MADHLAILNALRPRCAICDRPVDELVAYRNEAEDELTFVAHCHGDIERVRLPRDVRVNQLSPAVAFATRKLVSATDG
jgi:hypothetical protein